MCVEGGGDVGANENVETRNRFAAPSSRTKKQH